MSITMVEIGWLAGFLEGDGSFHAQYRTPAIAVTQVERFPLHRLRQLVGGAIYERRQGSSKLSQNLMGLWQLQGTAAVGLMMTIYPLLSPSRQAQILRTLAVWRAVKPRISVQDHAALAALRRIAAGERMERVAKDLGVSNVIVGLWVRGRVRPHLLDLLRAEGVIGDPWPPYRLPERVEDDVALAALRRVQAGESISRIAKEIGVAREIVRDWVHGRRRGHLVAQLRHAGEWGPLRTRGIPTAVALKAMRAVQSGVSMSQAARDIGANVATISEWMSGKKRPYLLAQLRQRPSE